MTTIARANRPAAIALASGACGLILVGLVHPRVGGGDVVTNLARLSPHLAAVHLLAIVTVVALLFGLVTFSIRRGLDRNAVLAAVLIYTVAVFAFIGAATIDGFVGPQLAKTADAHHLARATTNGLLFVCYLSIQVLTKGAILAVGGAIGLWSLDLWRTPGVRRSVGLLGFAVAAATTAFIITIDQVGAQALVIFGLLQALWYAAIAALLANPRI